MAEYRPLINKGWLAAICCVCGKESLPLSFDHGIGVWVTPFDLIKSPDRTQEVVDKFARINWLIEYKRATCPQCRTDSNAKKETADAAPGFD